MNLCLTYFFAISNLRDTTRLERYCLSFSKVTTAQIDTMPIWRPFRHYFRRNHIIKIICLQEKARCFYRHSLKIIGSASTSLVRSLHFRIQEGGFMRNRASHSRSWSLQTWFRMLTRQYFIPNLVKTRMSLIFLSPWLIGSEPSSLREAQRRAHPKLRKPRWPTTISLPIQLLTRARCKVNFLLKACSPKKWASDPEKTQTSTITKTSTMTFLLF